MPATAGTLAIVGTPAIAGMRKDRKESNWKDPTGDNRNKEAVLKQQEYQQYR
jgi:hypothetical protein